MTLAMRLVMAITAVVALIQCALWGFAAYVFWIFRGGVKAELPPRTLPRVPDSLSFWPPSQCSASSP